MRINLPESPTLDRAIVTECFMNGLLTAIPTCGLCYLFERNCIVPCLTMLLSVSLCCRIWAWCEERQIALPSILKNKSAEYDVYEAEDEAVGDEVEEVESEDDSAEVNGFADSHLIPETSIVYPNWFTCTITRSLGSAKAHNLFAALLNGTINRSTFCAATGKSQLEYPSWLQSWFDMGLLERKGKAVKLTYSGEGFTSLFVDKIEAM